MIINNFRDMEGDFMEISKTELKSCDLYKVTGRIDSLTSPKVAEAVAQSTNRGRFSLILDLSAVDYVSSAGLRVMINVQKTCRNGGRGELVLSGVTKVVLETLEIAGFIPLFKLFDNNETAIANFRTTEESAHTE